MHRIPVLTILLLSITIVLQAQTYFKPGYIIQNTGDTVFGQIDYRGNALMATVCTFKDANNQITKYTPYDIAGYRLTDSKFYISKEIKGTKVFLEYLINASVNMYYMRDIHGEHYYIDKDGMPLNELPYSEGLIYGDGIKQYETTRHIGILKIYMNDAPNFESKLATVHKPDHQNLIKLAKDYNDAVCNGTECIIYEKNIPFIKLSIEPTAAFINYSFLDNSIPEYGAYLNFWFPMVNEKLFFKTGFLFNQFYIDSLKIKNYKIPLQFQYIYNARKLQPTISGGINLNIFDLEDYTNPIHTLAINAGIYYAPVKWISLGAAINSEYTPLILVLTHKNSNFELYSYSFAFSVRVNL